MPAKDYNNYMREYMLRRYYRRRGEAIEKLGGQCKSCGTTDDLEFDHIDPDQKEYSIAKIFTSGSEGKVQAEVAKCQLLCTDCHKKKHHTSVTQR